MILNCNFLLLIFSKFIDTFFFLPLGMQRKDFIALTVPLISIIKTFGKDRKSEVFQNGRKIPPYLDKGDTIGITCPSGYISLEEIKPAVNKIREWGFEVKVGETVGLKEYTLAGNDEQRVNDLQLMLDNDAIKAILFGRGGYGAIRIIDKINFNHFKKYPKWIIGFSDATVFHNHINKNFGIATLHSKMCNSFPSDYLNTDITQINSIESIRTSLSGKKNEFSINGNTHNRNGFGEGELVGGNLSIIQNLSGTLSGLNTHGKILFLEDVDEYLYSIDRMFWNLHRCGMFLKLKGLIIGNFKIKPDDPGQEFGKNIYDIVMEKVNNYSYPVLFDFPVGHQKENYALKCGIKHQLIIESNITSLTEL